MKEHARTILPKVSWILFAIPVILAFSGCQATPPKITVEDARVEFSQAMKDEASIYLKIVNIGGPDKLLGAQVNIPGATADIHEMSGMMMTIVKEFDIPANSTTDFRNGASHIMLTDLPADLGEGDRFTLTLKFQKSGELSVPLTFTTSRPQPKMESMSDMTNPHQH